MKYQQTLIWKAAFEETRSDTTVDEQRQLSACYESMRQRASSLVSKIAADLPHMTIHDVTHLDALWEMASIASGKGFDLNPAEAFVFGGAVLLHDAAMCLAAFPGGISELRQQTEWRDLYARYASSVSAEDNEGIINAENRATEDALRLIHAKQAENLPMISWLGPQKQPMFIIEDQQIRNFYGSKIGKIAYSHWWSISKVDNELAGTLGPLAGVTDCTVDLLKVACLLRVADAMHLDQRRAPAFEFALSQPAGVSANHWKFQERMAKPFIQGDALIYTAQPPFEVDSAEAWWTAFDALQMVDRELRDVDRVLRDRQKATLSIRRVEGVHSPTDLARTIETVGWEPVDSTVRVSDVPNIVSTLGGSKLYGSGQAAPIRELIQNGLDAITARRRLQSRPNKWGELIVILQERNGEYWLCFEDNGVGMSPLVLTGPLIDFGNSFWKSSLAIQEFPGLASTRMKARGKYGIGFFSAFMLGDQVRVISRRFDRNASSARVLEFRNGLGSRPNMREASLKEAPIDGGTRVEIKLPCNPKAPEGLLYKKAVFKDYVAKLDEVIMAIAPSCDVTIRIVHDDETIGSTIAGDWLDIDSYSLIVRITGGGEALHKPISYQYLTELRDDEGKIFGRAQIDASDSWQKSGLLVVDGLAASKVGLIAGILTAVETTASRNSAKPIVPAPVLAAWSSEQAITLSKAALPDTEKAKVAEIVMACGGDIDNLPIVLWQKKWMTSAQFVSAVQHLNHFILHDGGIDHDEDDDVTKRDFEAFFEAKEEIGLTANEQYRKVQNTDWIVAITKGNGTAPVEVIEALLSEAWDDVESDDDVLVVGECNGIDISRAVSVYRRLDVEEDIDNLEAE